VVSKISPSLLNNATDGNRKPCASKETARLGQFCPVAPPPYFGAFQNSPNLTLSAPGCRIVFLLHTLFLSPPGDQCHSQPCTDFSALDRLRRDFSFITFRKETSESPSFPLLLSNFSVCYLKILPPFSLRVLHEMNPPELPSHLLFPSGKLRYHSIHRPYLFVLDRSRPDNDRRQTLPSYPAPMLCPF